jgi:hypothetical protein
MTMKLLFQITWLPTGGFNKWRFSSIQDRRFKAANPDMDHLQENGSLPTFKAKIFRVLWQSEGAAPR